MLLTAAGIFIAHILPAQQHQNVWFRETLSIPVNHNLKAEAEFQQRRQNGFENNNMFDKTLMYAFRSWLYFQYNENIKFSVSPFAFFSNYKIIQNQADETARPNHEIRLSAAAELQQPVFRKASIANRTAAEIRMFQTSQTNMVRLRNRFTLHYVINNEMGTSLFDELLFNVKGTAIAHFFDHNRTGISLDYKISSRVKIDMGYIHIKRLSATDTNVWHENNIFLNGIYVLYIKKRT